MIFVINTNAGMTFFATKGKLWTDLQNFEKFIYVLGLMDGAMLGGMKVQGVPISTKLDAEQYVKAIDEFYLDYKNANIPAPFVLKVISFELAGASEEEVNEIILKLRRQNSK